MAKRQDLYEEVSLMTKKSNVALVTTFLQLSTKEELTKNNSKELWKLRRTLESRGLNPASSHLMDCAIILDNRPQVEGYLTRSNDKEMHFARKSNGRNTGKIKANALEAEALKELGLTTTDPRFISKMLANITAYKKAVEKMKSTRRVNNMRALSDEAYSRAVKEFEREERDDEELAPQPQIDYDAITAFATQVFMPA